jgi:2-polyprenyl-3-methyl-5-hydroxy-6-metoxy-1,4-benzoquinol methylase
LTHSKFRGNFTGMTAELSKIQQVNKSAYDKHASEYEERVKGLEAVTSEAVSLFMKYLSGNEVLETGCGVGAAQKTMVDQGLNVTAIDISPEMVKYATKRNPGSQVILGDFIEYDFGRQFDGIFAFAFIHLFPKETALDVMHKMYDLLEPGGILYMGTTKSRRSYEGWEAKMDYDKPQERFRKHWTQKEMDEALNRVGFRKLACYLIEDPYKKMWMDFVVQKPK